MAQSIQEIKNSLPPVGKKIVNGVETEYTESEKESILNEWAENERARQLDEEANGYKEARKLAYPPIEQQLDEIFHNGIDSWKATIQQIKDDNPKPSE